MAITTKRPAGSRRLLFIRNRCYKGVDYGPDYTEDQAVVEEHWARQFISQGAAVEAPAGVNGNASDEAGAGSSSGGKGKGK